MAEWPFKAAVSCTGGIVIHEALFDRKGTSREGVVRLKGRWGNNSGLIYSPQLPLT